MIKGAATLTQKNRPAVAEKFVCIVDGSKYVEVLGKFPLPIGSFRWHGSRSPASFYNSGTPILARGLCH